MVLLIVTVLIVFINECYVAYGISRYRKAYIKKHGLRAPALSLFYRAVKRFCDIIISLAVCLSVIPILYIVLGVIIKMTSKGPIIFKQKRCGMFGREFTCYKFRSMYHDVPDYKVMRSSDERITPIGRFIRRTHLDEIPQFFNVLKGDMSLVGPRPLPDREVRRFPEGKDKYLRIFVRPGLTGFTQMKSGRLLSPNECLRSDIEYLSKPSLLKDFFLLLKTLELKDIAY